MDDQRLEIVQGDITLLPFDAIVNAANSALAPGGGVDGAIRRAAGPAINRATAEIGGCPTGEARLTRGFDLPARWVIHTVGPRWRGGGHDEDRLLAACYRNSLALAVENGIRTVAFPAISTGIYGFPPRRAAGIAVGTVLDCLAKSVSLARVALVSYAADDLGILEEARSAATMK